MFGVGFLSPLFLLGALAVAIPIALHLFHRRTEVIVDFPAVRLLRRGPVEMHRRRRLRELILLALRMAALVLLALSFARPYLASAIAPLTAPLSVIAVDTSLSMSAPGQMDQARAAADRAVRAVPNSSAVALVSFADSAVAVIAPTTDRSAVIDAIQALNAGAGGTRYRTALAKASELIGTRAGHVTVFTDLQQSGWDASDDGGLPDGVGVDVVSIAPPRTNLAVTSAEPHDCTMVATVQNYGREPAKTIVTLMVDGKPAANLNLEIAPQSATDARFPVSLPAKGDVQVSVEDPVGYQGDNTRYVSLDSALSMPVTIIVADPAGTARGMYIERALSVIAGGREFRAEAVDGRQFSSWTTDAVANRAAVVLSGTRTLDRRGRELVKNYLAAGGQALVTLGPDVDPATLADIVGTDLGVIPAPVKPSGGSATLVPSDARHPIFRPFLTPSGALGDVLVEQYRRLKDADGRLVLARFPGGDVALAEQPVGKGRVILFTSDLDNQWGRFPLNAAFVPFAVETMRYLTAGQRQRTAYMLPDVPAGVAPTPGIADIGAGSRVAINVDTRESNPASTSVEGFTSAINRIARAEARPVMSQARDAEEQQRWWRVGLIVMIAALAGEALVGRSTT
jgi:hypothetical protein